MDGDSESPFYATDWQRQFTLAFPNYTCRRCSFDAFTVIAPTETVHFDSLLENLRTKGENKKVYEEMPVASRDHDCFSRFFVDVVCDRCGCTERFFGPTLATTSLAGDQSSGE